MQRAVRDVTGLTAEAQGAYVELLRPEDAGSDGRKHQGAGTAGCGDAADAWWTRTSARPSWRARRLIGDATTTLTWGGGATVTRAVDGADPNGHMSFPRTRYLSQQFVEELCSAKGVSDGLIEEIERVIFASHSQDDREWALDFAELRDQQTSRFQQAREREAEAISDISDRIATEFEKESLVASLTTQVGQKNKLIADYTADRAKLVVKGTEVQVARHTQLSEAAQKLRNKIQNFGNQRRTFVALQDEVRSMRARERLKYSAKHRRDTPIAAWMRSSGRTSS
nr:hypothetical protein [Phyllobacterium salinisoli]